MKGPNTYLHAGYSKLGWPHDHTAEDTFALPPLTDGTSYTPKTTEERQYRAVFSERGEALLVLDTSTTIAKFNTFADAQTAAEALNNLKGY